MAKRQGKIVFFITFFGGVLGAVLGHVLADTIPILDKGLKVGADSLSLDLYLLDISFSIHVNITLGAIIGLLIAFLLADVGTRRRS
ncbi:MAG: DUF4321 domain-containing protein [Actinomycetia bacterium]|nr:DUF4321 domain-containing protein [Actinomycetes bacterium]